MPTVDRCCICHFPVHVAAGQTCYACYRTVCPSCARTDQAGDILCHDCHGDMTAFLAEGVLDGPAPAPLPGDREVQLPGPR